MALWGATEATKPTWCTDDSPVADKQAVFATESGWVLRHYKKAVSYTHLTLPTKA